MYKTRLYMALWHQGSHGTPLSGPRHKCSPFVTLLSKRDDDSNDSDAPSLRAAAPGEVNSCVDRTATVNALADTNCH